MGFRGIGDTATQVKMQQNQQALQAASIAENARQANMSQASQTENRKQQAAQFDASLGQRASEFEAARADDSAQNKWKQDFAERNMAAQTGMNERKMRLDEFGSRLSALTAQSDMAAKDTDTQLKHAQLNQYVAATADEEKRRRNRENMSKGAFGSLAISGILNGGTMPVAAIELANRELGDKDNQITGGGIDPESGIAFFDVRRADGTVKQLKMPPENQFSVLKDVYGDDVAKLFADNYRYNKTVSSAIERARIAADAAAQNKNVITPNNRAQAANAIVRDVDTQLKAFDAANPGMLLTDEKKVERDAIAKQGDGARQFLKTMFGETASTGAGGASTKGQETVLNATELSDYGIPPTYKAFDNGDGTIRVVFQKDGKTVSGTLRPKTR